MTTETISELYQNRGLCKELMILKLNYCMFFKRFFYCCSITVVLVFLPLPFSAHPPTPTVSPHAVVHVHASFIHDHYLDPSPSFHHYPSSLPSGHCQSVPCFHSLK